jgi:hypothetical protein
MTKDNATKLPLNVKLTILKGHYFKRDILTGNMTAPHGNHYSDIYLNDITNDEFESILRKETI